MPESFVDEIVIRYLMKEGYLVVKGIWFPLPKEKTGKKVSGWSDIDILAVKPNCPTLIVQCKSFSGIMKAEKFVKKIVTWYDNAIEFLKKSPYKEWIANRNYKKVFVVHSSVKKTEEELKKRGIEVWNFKEILRKLLKKLKEEQEEFKKRGQVGKEEDALLKIFSIMIRKGLIKI